MSRDIRINLIAKDDVSGQLEKISVSASKTGDNLERAGSDGAKGLEQVSRAAKETAASIDRSAVAAGALGATIMSALVVPIGMGAKAAWDQVSAVEQATLAFRAYETDARKVNNVLEELIAYAQSDLGRLFQRQELFAAAQGLKVAGAETENLARYVEILGRSVSIGLGTWDELVRVISRVGTTSRITGEDFEMLQKMGFQLDAEIRNSTTTWEDLFRVLDEGIGRVGGQTDTIIGQMTMTASSFRSLGQEFLGVNQASQFADQSLGSFAYGSLAATREILEAMQPVARAAGESLAFFAGGVQMVLDATPSGLQTTIISLVGGFGALTVGASATVLAFNQMSRAGNALKTTYVALGNTMRAHPILFIAGIVGGVALSAWARHRQNVDSARAAYEAFDTAAKDVQQTIANTWLTGDVMNAPIMELMHRTTMAGIDRWTIELNRGKDAYWEFTEAVINRDQEVADAFAESNFFKSMLEYGEREGMLDSGLVETFLSGNLDEIGLALPALHPVMEAYWNAYLPTEGDKTAILEAQDDMFQLLLNPEVDSHRVRSEWDRIMSEYIFDAENPNLQGAVNAWQEAESEIITSIGKIEVGIDGLTRAQRDFRLEVLQMRLDGDGQLASDLGLLNQLLMRNAGTSEEAAQYMDFLEKNVRGGSLAVDDMSSGLEYLNILYRSNLISQREYDLGVIAVTNSVVDQAEAQQGLNDEIDLSNSHVLRQIELARENAQAKRDEAEAFVEYTERVGENLDALIEVAGYGDPLSRWNLEGHGERLSLLAMNANQAAAGLDSIFRVVVGNTNAIGSQFDQIFKWADELIAEEGVWSKLDELLDAGRIEGKHGVFTGDSDYALAQQAFNSIAEDNLRVQEAILTIQAKQAPYIAEQANAYADLIDEISRMPAEQQLAVLGWMDQATALKAVELQTLAVKAANGELGAEGKATFESMLNGILATSPELRAMASEWGWLIENSDGTFTVNWSGVTEGKSEIAQLTLAIVNLIDLFDDGVINGSFILDAEDNATSVVNSAAENLMSKHGLTATMVIQTERLTIDRYVGPTPYALGGTLPGYANGGVLFRAGEWNRPEIAHFATGGTALIPRDGLYTAPPGTYISPNNAISNSYGGVTVNISGNTFNHTTEEAMNQWAIDVFIPEFQRSIRDLYVGMGMVY